MGLICELTHGANSLNLHDNSRYLVGREFAPPSALLSANLSGRSGNLSGQDLVSVEAWNIEYSFPIHILGDTEAEVLFNASYLQSFINRAWTDHSRPLLFRCKGNADISRDPLWGQWGACRNYQVVKGTVQLPQSWGGAARTNDLLDCTVSLQLKPMATGKRQRLGSAIGGVIEDRIGTVDGSVRGMRISEACAKNYFTNPIFGYASIWDTSWSVSGALDKTANYDTRWILFGLRSCRLENDSASAANLYASITADNTNSHTLSCYARRLDGGTIDATVCQLLYNTAQTTTYTALGNGWYRLTYTGAGVASAYNTGIVVQPGYVVFVDGFQYEQKAYASSLCCGDLLGNAWAAAPTTSSRTAGRIRVAVAAETFERGLGSVRIVWKTDYNQDHANDMFFFSTGAAGFRLYFESSDNKFYFTDNTNTISSAAQTFAAGDILVLVATWGPGGLNIIKNGVSIASGANFQMPVLPTYFYIGTDDSAANHANGIFLGFSIFDRKLTTAECLADYTNITQHVSGGDGYGQMLESIPCVWTKDGDNVIDLYDDSTHDDFGVVLGIGGDQPAETWLVVDPSGDGDDVVVGKHAWREFLPQGSFSEDESGTVWAGALGGEVYQDLCGPGTEVEFDWSTKSWYMALDRFKGQPICCLVSAADAGSSLTAKIGVTIGTAYDVSSEYIPVAADGTLKMFLLGPYWLLPDYEQMLDGESPPSLQFTLTFCRETGASDANVSVDWIRFWIGDVAWVEDVIGYILLHGREGILWGPPFGGFNTPRGQEIEFEPGLVNHIWVVTGDLGANTTLTNTGTIQQAYYAPRYALV